jgi:hypothetical protein
MAKLIGTVHTCGRGLLRGWWLPVGPKLVFDHMAATVPEIMDISGTILNSKTIDKLRRKQPLPNYLSTCPEWTGKPWRTSIKIVSVPATRPTCYLLCPLWEKSHSFAPQDHEHLLVSEGTVQSTELHTTVSCDHLSKLSPGTGYQVRMLQQLWHRCVPPQPWSVHHTICIICNFIYNSWALFFICCSYTKQVTLQIFSIPLEITLPCMSSDILYVG